MNAKIEMSAEAEEMEFSILVVEDEPIVRMLVVDQLDDLGYRTVEAQDGHQALVLLRERGRFDLLLTDVGLPGMDGRELASAARDLQPDLKILFATGYAASHATMLGLPAPGMDLVGKPFDTDELARRIRGLLGR
jgi:CheY-like chemotaxis protein